MKENNIFSPCEVCRVEGDGLCDMCDYGLCVEVNEKIHGKNAGPLINTVWADSTIKAFNEAWNKYMK